LIQLLAELEAGLDFVDEDIEFITSAEVVRRLSDAACLVANVQQQMATRADQSPRAQAVLLGPPNVGKSSLFNALLDQYGVDCQASAIVSAERGTTRDYLLANLDLDGTRCQLVDTAGTGDDGLDEIDRAAQSHSRERGQRATVRLQCVEARQAGELVISTSDAPTLVVVTKADTIVGVSHGTIPASAVVTSVHTGQGIADLTVAIRAALKRDDAGDQPGVVASTAERCRESLRLASQSLAMASDLAENDGGDELIAAEIHTALHEIGKVVGAVSTDDILDRVFSSFCIGK
jgi:tRNA modification GTPase